MPTPLQPQAALEQAIANAIIANLGYTIANCKRMYNAQPPPICPLVFASVWHDLSRTQGALKTSLDEQFGVYVTLTVLCTQPFDRWVVHRDDIEARGNAIRALVQASATNYAILNAANVLANYDNGNTRPVGFREAICFLRFDPLQEVGAQWFNSHVDKPASGLALRLVFGKVRRVQANLTAS